mmetsp:Transcript_30907/g.65673  ORF Transcript_30907/g.65673 Transcript_30907/m.65673 type:complete len:85 (-) Transcript_30907:2130-2384(-)
MYTKPFKVSTKQTPINEYTKIFLIAKFNLYCGNFSINCRALDGAHSENLFNKSISLFLNADLCNSEFRITTIIDASSLTGADDN